MLAPEDLVQTWAGGEEIGLYFQLPAASSILTIAIEKDLECVDGPLGRERSGRFPTNRRKGLLISLALVFLGVSVPFFADEAGFLQALIDFTCDEN